MAAAMLCAGCGILANAANAMPLIVKAAYPGLKGKTTAVMVWPEPAVKINYPRIQADIIASLQQKLMDVQKKDKPEDLQDTAFPVSWQSMMRYQENNPDADSQPIEQTAREVGVQRLIYIEVAEFQTRSDISPDLYRGQIVANLKVVELENGKVKTGYEENNITVKFPPKGPDEGWMNLGDENTYVGTIKEFTGKIAWKFYKHEEDRQLGEGR
jgi:hypothetical protein